MASKNAETLSLVYLLSSDMKMSVQQPLLTPNFTLSEELLEIRLLAPSRNAVTRRPRRPLVLEVDE